jgi:hypothetical protein
VADQEDVRRIALALPDTSESAERFAFCVSNKGKQKGFVWAWNERVEPKKPRVPRDDVVAVRVVDEFDKEALLASDEAKFFTEPQYNGFPCCPRPTACDRRRRARGAHRGRLALPGAPGPR